MSPTCIRWRSSGRLRGRIVERIGLLRDLELEVEHRPSSAQASFELVAQVMLAERRGLFVRDRRLTVRGHEVIADVTAPSLRTNV